MHSLFKFNQDFSLNHRQNISRRKAKTRKHKNNQPDCT
ncbi:hypothetical protein HS9_02222 [Bacillus velezensis]|nr:hypothetical protein HS9_02222 [Bacillus velezensis]